MSDTIGMVLDAFGDGLVAKGGVYQEYVTLMAHPIPTYAAQGEHLPSFAARALQEWRPYDTRWYLAQDASSPYSHAGSSLSSKIQHHTKVSLLGVSDASFEMGLYMDGHADEFDRYDDMVRRSWHEGGASGRYVNDLGEEVGGTSLRTRYGGIATPATTPSPHLIDIPDGPIFTDRLADVPHPKADWRLKAILKVDVLIHDEYFIFDYTVHSDKGLLMSGTLRHTDLRRITRSLYHVVFGSKERGEVLDMLDGYRQLLAKEKLPGAPAVSVPEVYARAGGSLNTLASFSPWIAAIIFLIGFLQGYGVPDTIYWVFTGIAILPLLFSIFLVPLLEAKEKDAASKSIL